MTQQTTSDLAKLVRAYTEEAAELLPDLCDATAHHDRSLNVTMRLCNWLGRFQIEAEEAMRNKGTRS